MKVARCPFLLIVLILPLTALAIPDYKVDLGFNAGFTFNDDVNDVFVLAGGKVLVAGKVCTSGSATSCTPILRRLNSDGSIDGTFSVAIGPITGGGGTVSRIKPLPSGQFLILGDFNVGTQRSNTIRISSEGVIDPNLSPTLLGNLLDLETTPDGKIVVCGERTINGQFYDVAYRLNADGTPDADFRITFIAGRCWSVEVQPDGKYVLAVDSDPGA
ncbi:MAG TPA: hypothetical protein VNA22_04515, partial [Pyrinomonadaceae bacterium]|nr:hypothetical protein [Pyrinomonadaceae bacterium]